MVDGACLQAKSLSSQQIPAGTYSEREAKCMRVMLWLWIHGQAARASKTTKVGVERRKTMVGASNQYGRLDARVHSEVHANTMRGYSLGGDIEEES